MKKSTSSTIAAVVFIAFFAGCSDPADKVHKSAASEPTKSAEAAPSEASVAPTTAASPAEAGKEYVIRSESTIGFTGSKVTGSHNGGFKNFTGTVRVLDGKVVGTPVIKIAMASTWADNDRVTGHLKSADFFDAARYPLATFTVTGIEPAGAQQKVSGNMDLHGVSKAISFPASVGISDNEVTIKAAFAINRKQWNINYPGRPNDLIRDNVVIKLDLKATPGPARPEDLLAR